MPAACRSCSAPIEWARTVNGRLIPLDAEPDPAGNVLLEDVQGSRVAHVLGARGDVPFELAHLDGPRYMPHHATCPSWGQR